MSARHPQVRQGMEGK